MGAGAAGLMTAIAAAREAKSRFSIILLDTRKKIGAKILISGGTRCNVTNRKVTSSDYEGGPKHFVKHVLEAFTPDQTIRFFKEMGVELILEPTGKYFPTTHSGKTVLEALMREADRCGVILKTGVQIKEIEKSQGFFRLKGVLAEGAEEISEIFARCAVLATGGLSYPETGSDGAGFLIAKKLGHTLVETSSALTPLLTNDRDWPGLSGVSLPAKLVFFRKGKKEKGCEGAFLFTHFGFSGPVALDISRHVARAQKAEKPEIYVSFLPESTGDSLRKFFEQERSQTPKKSIKHSLIEAFKLPERFVEVFLEKIGIPSDLPMRQFSKLFEKKFINSVLNYKLEVSGVYGYRKAEVTAGGVDLKEVDYATMQSKVMPGLYFAGEILDMDGRIGGFNFQWAWSSGAIAGRAAIRSL